MAGNPQAALLARLGLTTDPRTGATGTGPGPARQGGCLMSSGEDRPTGRQTASTGTGEPRTAGAHSAGYQEGYPSETVDYGQGGTGQGYPSESASATGQGRRAGARAYPERAGYGRGEAGAETRRGPGLAASGALLILSGLITFFAGITGVIKGAFYGHPANYPFVYSIRSWGITEIVIGAVVFMVGACLLLGMEWARWAAVVIATLSAIANFMFLPYYPFWTIIVIAIDIFIIWECARGPRRREYA
jgi:hypothetical protein